MSILNQGGNWLQLTDCGEFAARNANHGKLSNFSTSSEIEQCKTNHTDFLVRFRSTSANETCRVLARTDLETLSDFRTVRVMHDMMTAIGLHASTAQNT
jgi:hypothetical protein